MKFYGSLNNRIDENKMYCDKIEVGTKMTEYHYSDREAYEVVGVINQNHIFVRRLDHKHIGDGEMDNNWELISNPNNPIIEMKKRYGYWNKVNEVTEESIKKVILVDKKVYDEVMKKGYATIYTKVNVSFGIAEYYYDYEF